MAQIRAKLRLVPKVEYFCGNCGEKLGSDELREGMNVSKAKLYLYHYYYGRCPKCKASLTKPEVDDCTVDGMTVAMLYETMGGRDAGSC